MLRTLALPLLGLVASTAMATTPAQAAPAQAPAALANPTMTCQILPSGVPPRQSTCGTFRAASTYVVDNAVQNGPASGYTWIVPAGIRVVGGCRTDTPFCDLSVRSGLVDQDITTSVVIPGFGTLTANAVIPAVCGRFLC
ncbi:hypothetical protein R8Z50_15780 [Longispora sp. K20-0274]|uniref:hypothetical protein n=1 Tax=Longispora sp. K20-0274 TaxID=3088255 RepID=UPI00399B11E6